MEPALAALLLRPAVPGDRQRLQAAVGELDQILLQRVDAEGVLHLERGELAVRPVGLDQELAVLAEEARPHAVMLEARVGEIAEHRPVGCMLHRELVLRRAPQLRFRLVTAGAGLAADEGGWRNGRRAAEERVPPAAGQELKCQAARDGDHRNDRRRNDDRPPRNASRRRIALSAARPVDIPWRSGRFLRSAFFPGTRFGTSHAVTARVLDRSLQIVHSLGGGERARAPGAISSCIEPLGARQGRRERRLRPLLGAFDRARRRLAIELCADRLRRHRPGVRVARGLAHRLLEFCDLAGAGTGMR